MRIITAAAAVMVFMILLTSCSAGSGSTDRSLQSDVSSGEETGKMQYHVMKMDDVLNAMDYVGKAYEETDIGEQFYSGSDTVYFEGKLFGADASGYVIARKDYNTDKRIIHSLTINVDALGFTDISRKLSLIWGPPYISGEEPYAQANGGAVRWDRFYTGSGILVLSNGSNNDYCSISYTLSDVPKEISDPAKAPPLYVTTADNFYFAFDRERFHDFSMKIPDDPEHSIVQIDFMYLDHGFTLLTITDCDEIPDRFAAGDWIREWEEDGVQLKQGDGVIFAAWADREFGHVFILSSNTGNEEDLRDCLYELQDSLHEEDR